MTAGALSEEPWRDTVLLQFKTLARIDGFSHAITTRPWNMAPHRGPEARRAVERRRLVCQHLGFEFDRLTAPEQIHGPHVLPVAHSDIGAGRLDRADAVRFVDGLVCDIAGVPLLQLSADCPLVLAVDPGRRVVGTAHASWRGTVARVATELIAVMGDRFNCRPGDLVAAICPCAGPERYEVGDDLRRIAIAALPAGDRYFPVGASGRTCFDLRSANVDQLRAAGVREDRICVATECTITDRRFFSHRRDGEGTGRFALIGGFQS
ncbi:MAG: polyphenol oxidase family protein [Planctomycetota bacterium]|nr:polyphenol oxidase family protein [Planctomycetota bacterium]